VAGIALELPFVNTVTGGSNCSGSAPVAPSFGKLGGPMSFPLPDDKGGTVPIQLFAIPLTFDPDFRIPATKFIDIGRGGVATLEWTAVSPVPAVRKDLAQ
jgi:hypothetical protein